MQNHVEQPDFERLHAKCRQNPPEVSKFSFRFLDLAGCAFAAIQQKAEIIVLYSEGYHAVNPSWSHRRASQAENECIIKTDLRSI
jgi:hypothetical protein